MITRMPTLRDLQQYGLSIPLTLYRMVHNNIAKLIPHQTSFLTGHPTLVFAVHGFYGRYSNFDPNSAHI